jgi:hypothetical protein
MTKKKITLPSGATVTLRDPKELRVKDRKKIYANTGKADEGIMQALSLSDGLLAVIIEDWSFDLIIPSIKIDSLDENSGYFQATLDIDSYCKIMKEAIDNCCKKACLEIGRAHV